MKLIKSNRDCIFFKLYNVHKITFKFPSKYVVIHEYNLKEVFLNVVISLRIFLTLPISNCEAERTDSK